MTAGSGHPDLDTLADLQEGLLDRDEERDVRRHVAGCAVCADTLDALDATQATLAAVPPVTIPEHVAARIERTLADLGPADAAAGPAATAGPVTGPATVVPPPARSPWWRSSAFATSAAAAVVVLLVAGIVASALRASHHNSTSTPPGAGGLASHPSSATTFTATASGRNYTVASLPAVIPSLLGHASTAVPSPSVATGTSGGGPSKSASSLRQGAPAPIPALNALARPQQLLDCVAALTGQPAGAVIPLAADLGSFQGRPAAVIVLPTPNRPTLLDVWVVGPGCSASDQQFLYFMRAPRPA